MRLNFVPFTDDPSSFILPYKTFDNISSQLAQNQASTDSAKLKLSPEALRCSLMAWTYEGPNCIRGRLSAENECPSSSIPRTQKDYWCPLAPSNTFVISNRP